MATKFQSLDSLGSFSDAERTIEAICWTHRGDGWSVHDWRSGETFGVRTKREAEAIVKRQLRRRKAAS